MISQSVPMAHTEILRILIVDPDGATQKIARETLAFRKDFQLVGECGSALEAIPILRDPGVDVVLCEAELPGISGFSWQEMIPATRRPIVIFMNHSPRFAAEAFDASAIDYLLKPFDPARLNTALDRAVTRARTAARARTAVQKSGAGRLAIRTGRSVLFLNTSELDWAEAEGKYVRLHLGKEALLLKMSITALEGELDSSQFVRIHRSTLVNVERVRWLQPWMNGRTYHLILHDGTKLVLSRKDHLRTFTQRAVVSV